MEFILRGLNDASENKFSSKNNLLYGIGNHAVELLDIPLKEIILNKTSVLVSPV